MHRKSIEGSSFKKTSQSSVELLSHCKILFSVGIEAFFKIELFDTFMQKLLIANQSSVLQGTGAEAQFS